MFCVQPERDSAWKSTRRFAGVLALFASFSLASCNSVESEPSRTDIDSAKTIAEVALNAADCETALQAIEPIVLSSAVDNASRQLYAGALACRSGMTSIVAGINRISAESSSLTTQLWQALTKVYYESDLQGVARDYTDALRAQDRLMTILKPGFAVALGNQFLVDQWNPASLEISDREEQSQFLQLFLSMQILGQIQVVHGDPDPTTFARQRKLGAINATAPGWEIVGNVDEVACGYAGAAVSMVEGIYSVADQVPDTLAPTLEFVADTYAQLLDDACDFSCRGIDATLSIGVDFTGNGCNFAADQCRGPSDRQPCLMALRNRAFCAGSNPNINLDEKTRCAASGIARFVNRAPVVGWSGTP